MFKTLKFFLFFPKIGPDMYLTHWLLYAKTSRLWFQKKKIYKIGTNSEIRPFVTINGTNSITIGDNVIIPPGTILSAMPNDPDNGIEISNDVLLGPNVSIYSATHNFDKIDIPIKAQGYNSKKVLIKEGAWIGVNSVILPGVTIGRNSVIGANSVVTKDIPDYSVAVGSPARVVKILTKGEIV
ncbi:MAG: acyltransferase [Arcobacteraceae bacterium]|jgi:acetyltransferase-like isoleucine patch superfamily enzyme|nr:acyltransferase [Arcobacteraceae bacterium]